MWKYVEKNDTKKWINVLPKLIENYNNSKHRSIKMTPIEGSKKENEIKVYKNLYVREKKIRKPKYKEGDKVRISKYKTKFQRGYDPTFTEEIFTISDVLKTDPINYRIKDLNGKEIKGTFYEQELV
ncbi:uncharacterized transposon-derived protein F54H12.3 [Trichonephila clavipes]|nr:uncharacterized transposon-derived protein F54H12.3 [Trichonephila clavipes]